MKPAEKIVALTKYVEGLKRRESAIPASRMHQEGQYRAWLKREIEVHSAKIEMLKQK